jgi:hypothetical protein
MLPLLAPILTQSFLHTTRPRSNSPGRTNAQPREDDLALASVQLSSLRGAHSSTLPPCLLLQLREYICFIAFLDSFDTIKGI